MRNSCIDTHISCLSSPEPSPKALSHRNQRARRGIKAVYIMKLKELLHGVSLTAPRKAFLLLQRIEERKKKGKKGEENPPEQCSTTTAKHYSERETDCENERARGNRKVVYLSQPHVPTESGIKIGPIVVSLWSVSPAWETKRERESERVGCNSHEVSVILLSEEREALQGKRKFSDTDWQTVCLHLA